MQKIKPGYLQHLLRIKIILVAACFFFANTSFAQLRGNYNLPNHDDKLYYFGIILGYNTSHYKISHTPGFLMQDSIQAVNGLNAGRIHLGILANLQISDRWDLRFYPLNLIFSEKRFQYDLKYPEAGETSLVKSQKVESIVMSFPLQVRLKSDRIKNFRVYTLAGVKFDYDLASKSGTTNSENLVKVNKTDFGVEAGIGFQFFSKYVIVSPEIKVSQGLNNVHAKDPSLRYSNIIDRLNSRMIMFSLQFEGGGLL
ncbi:MAG: PorT family protein [Chitinophagaceae bacterium]|nr:PorT family protein [Chitinophagaceae bacterium]MCW5929692.1 PorT family protein [Chitinophagaceae bacterium]